MTDSPVTQWITGVKNRDSDAEAALWNHYFGKVVRLAQSRMLALQGTIYDQEDAASSALRSLFRGMQTDRFPELNDRQNLWLMLVLITKRKLRAQWRRENANRRKMTQAAGMEAEIGIEELVSKEPTPDFVAELMDKTEQLFENLGDDKLRQIALMRMDGWTNDEIAENQGCASRTIRRKIERIREIWAASQTE